MPQKRKKAATCGEAGFMGVESLGSLAFYLILMSMLAYLIHYGMNEVRNRVISDHLIRVTRAAQAYTRKHYDTLLAGATSTAGAEITIATLRDESFLPPGFSAVNGWGQSYSIHVRQPVAGELHTYVLTTGGRQHSDKEPEFATTQVPAAAAMAGGFAGYVPTGLLAGQSSDELRGALGGWVQPLSSIGLPSVGAGHLGAVVNLTAQDMGKDFLYRMKIPGHPELNAMFTGLDMTDHSINNVKSLRFTETPLADMADFCTTEQDNGRMFVDKESGMYLCRNGQVEVVPDSGNSTVFRHARLAVNGETVSKPVCAPGTNTHPEIFVAPAIVATGAEAPPIASLQAWSTNLSDTEWQVHLRVLTADSTLDWVYPAPDYGKISVFTTCAKD